MDLLFVSVAVPAEKLIEEGILLVVDFLVGGGVARTGSVGDVRAKWLQWEDLLLSVHVCVWLSNCWMMEEEDWLLGRRVDEFFCKRTVDGVSGTVDGSEHRTRINVRMTITAEWRCLSKKRTREAKDGAGASVKAEREDQEEVWNPNPDQGARVELVSEP